MISFGLVFFQGFAVNGINSVNLASYERQFQLTSRQSSMVSSVYDICAGFTVSVYDIYAVYRVSIYNICTGIVVTVKFEERW